MMLTYDCSILDLSLYAAAPGDALMIALRAYGDESGKENDPNTPCIAMGTVLGDASSWPAAEARWRAMLDKHQIPDVHMKNIRQCKGPFRKYLAPYLMLELFDDMATVILESKFTCAAISVRREDFEAICRDFDIQTNLYSFTLYVNCVMLGTMALNARPENPRLQIILDRIEKGTSLVAEAERLYRGDNFNAWRGWPLVSALSPQSPEGSLNLPALQMADAVAWHARNELVTRWEWFREIKPTLGENNFEEWNRSLEAWLLADRAKWTGDPAQYFKFHRFLARLDERRAFKVYHFDYERLKNHIFSNRCAEYPIAAREDAIRRSGLIHPLTP